MFQRSFFSVAALCILAGCATPHVVQSVKTSDSSLSFSQIAAEMAESDRFRSDAQKEKGMTGTNVAAVIFLWPAMIGTCANANEAIAAADTRKVNLMGLYNQKKCQDADLSTSAERSNTVSTTERKLGEIKEILDRKLSTQIKCDAQRKKILASIQKRFFNDAAKAVANLMR